jgi:hypothetical protein
MLFQQLLKMLNYKSVHLRHPHHREMEHHRHHHHLLPPLLLQILSELV